MDKYNRDRRSHQNMTSISRERKPSYASSITQVKREPSITISRYPREISSSRVSIRSYVTETKREPSITINRYPSDLSSSRVSYVT